MSGPLLRNRKLCCVHELLVSVVSGPLLRIQKLYCVHEVLVSVVSGPLLRNRAAYTRYWFQSWLVRCCAVRGFAAALRVLGFQSWAVGYCACRNFASCTEHQFQSW